MSQNIVSVESASFILGLFVSCVDLLIGTKTFMRNKCFEPLQKQRAMV